MLGLARQPVDDRLQRYVHEIHASFKESYESSPVTANTRLPAPRNRLADRRPPIPDEFVPVDFAPEVETRQRLRGLWFGMIAVVYFVVYLLWQVTRVGGASHVVVIGDAFFIPVDVLAVFSAITAAKRCQADRRRCRSWAFVSVAMVGYLIGDLLQLYGEGIRHFADSPDWSDAVFFIFFFIGLLGFTTNNKNVVRRWLFTLDIATIALSSGAVLWFLIVDPVLTTQGHSTHAIVFAVLYPLGDLVLLLAAVRILQRGVPSSSQTALQMIAAGIFCYVVTDTLQNYMALRGGYHGGEHVDILGMLAATIFAVAGSLQTRPGVDETRRSQSGRTGSAGISYASVTAVFVIVFVIQRHERIFPDLVIRAAAVLSASLVAIGQVTSRKALIKEQTKSDDLFGKLQHQAFHDDLTGLANRALFSERLEHALERRTSFALNHAVLMIDLNGFKAINDTLGHEAGDEVLRIVAARLTAAVRRGDTVARIGGDEFAILFEDVKGSDATVDLVGHLLSVVGEPITIGQRKIVPDPSIGIALTGEEPLTADELLRFADTAMYQAKQQHSVHYCVFETEMQKALDERAELESGLHGAVGRGELRVFYQPILNLVSQETIGFEALVRWMHPSRGLLQPLAFLPLAEQCGLIHEIDTCVLYQACLEASRWQRLSPQFAQIGVHVNLSPLQLKEPDLIDTIKGALSTSGLEPKFLTLELLESSVVDDLELAQVRLTELKVLGVRLAVDDFGTGFSSLSHLRTLPIDELKIDRSFIAAMNTSAQANTLVQSLIQLGAALRIDTVAEGIEDLEQLSRLQDEECLHGQGYLFARPLDREDLRSYLLDQVGGLTGSQPRCESVLASSIS